MSLVNPAGYDLCSVAKQNRDRDSLHAVGSGNMAFSGAWSADQDDIVGTVEEFAAVQLADQGLVHLTGRKIELGSAH